MNFLLVKNSDGYSLYSHDKPMKSNTDLGGVSIIFEDEFVKQKSIYKEFNLKKVNSENIVANHKLVLLAYISLYETMKVRVPANDMNIVILVVPYRKLGLSLETVNILYDFVMSQTMKLYKIEQNITQTESEAKIVLVKRSDAKFSEGLHAVDVTSEAYMVINYIISKIAVKTNPIFVEKQNAKKDSIIDSFNEVWFLTTSQLCSAKYRF